MAGHCTRGLYFHSPSARENMTHPLVQYPAILHSTPLNNIYLLFIIIHKIMFTHLQIANHLTLPVFNYIHVPVFVVGCVHVFNYSLFFSFL